VAPASFAAASSCLDRRIDFSRARGKGEDGCATDIGDFKLPVARVLCRHGAISQGFDPGAQVSVVNRGDGRLLVVELIVLHRPPGAIGAQGRIRDHAVDMQLWIAIARQVMGENGGDHISRFDRRLGAGGGVKLPRLDQVFLDPAQRCPSAIL